MHSYKEDITLSNQGETYTFQLINPLRGSVVVKFLSQGNWYELRDDGNGKLVGTSQQYGSGSINYDTGAGTITCGQLPDVGGALIVNYAQNIYFKPPKPVLDSYLPIALSERGFGFNLTVGTKKATVTGGKITGDFGGHYDIANNRLLIEPTISREPIVVDYQTGVVAKFSDGGTVSNDVVTIQLGAQDIKPSTVFFTAKFANGNEQQARFYYDDGNGNITFDGVTVGSINYQTGVITFKASHSVTLQKPVYEEVAVNIGYASGNMASVGTVNETRLVRYDSTDVTLSYVGIVGDVIYLKGVGAQKTETFTTPNLVIDIKTDNDIALNSLVLAIGDKIYQENGDFIYVGDKQVGSRLAKRVTLTEFDMAKPDIKALIAKIANVDDRVKNLSFTTPRLRPASLKLTVDGTNAVSDVSGNITLETGTKIGTVNADKGIVTLALPTPAREIIWQAVSVVYMPIDTSIIKIDTVRLPPDGRVPIFRVGDDILISNRKIDNLGSAFTGGQTINLSRADVDRICLNDADNKPVIADLWDYDLDTGSITFKPSIDLSAYKMPLSAVHTQEERNVITKVDIDGTLSLKFPNKRSYAIEDTFVSSMLLHDNLQVRVSVPFTQKAWKNIWSDKPDGEQLLNKLRLTDYPMILTDDGAITDRWLIKFISGSQFELYSEALGFVGKFDTLTNLAPINPATQKPYFTIDKRAFGGADAQQTPWAAQDVIRFNTWGTLVPVWVLCAVQPTNNPYKGKDGFEQYLFGDTTEITA